MDSNIVLPSLSNINNAQTPAAPTTNNLQRLLTNNTTAAPSILYSSTNGLSKSFTNPSPTRTNPSTSSTTNGTPRPFTNPSNPSTLMINGITSTTTNTSISSSSSSTFTDVRKLNASILDEMTREAKRTFLSSNPERMITPPLSNTPIPLITDGLSTPTSTTPTTILPTPTSLDVLLLQVDTLLKAASIAAFQKSGANVAVVSCKYSTNILQNNISNFIFTNKPSPSHFLVPFFSASNDRIVLAVFYTAEKKVGFYDSLKELPSDKFWLVKYVVEKWLDTVNFDECDQKSINSTINANPFPSLATFHICRIAEQICFNGKNKLLKPFNIADEVERFNKIVGMVSDPNWRGEWLPTIQDSRIQSVVEDVIMGGTGKNGGGREIDIDTTVSDGGGIQQQQQRSRSTDGRDESARKRRSFEEMKKKLDVTQSSMDIYEKKFPILSQMLKLYLNFTKLRFDHYKRAEIDPTIKEEFNYNDCIQMNHFDTYNGMPMFKQFPFFADLPGSDQSDLIHRFREPFLLFERIYDTLNTIGSRLDDKHIMLQNGDCYKFETLNNAKIPSNLKNVFKIIFAAWESLLPILQKIEPDIIEAVYIFCCILWNSFYLKKPLSKEGEEMILRGRMMIHKEMREFYGYDESQWERIYALRHVLIMTERAVDQYKKRAEIDKI